MRLWFPGNKGVAGVTGKMGYESNKEAHSLNEVTQTRLLHLCRPPCPIYTFEIFIGSATVHPFSTKTFRWPGKTQQDMHF